MRCDGTRGKDLVNSQRWSLIGRRQLSTAFVIIVAHTMLSSCTVNSPRDDWEAKFRSYGESVGRSLSAEPTRFEDMGHEREVMAFLLWTRTFEDLSPTGLLLFTKIHVSTKAEMETYVSAFSSGVKKTRGTGAGRREDRIEIPGELRQKVARSSEEIAKGKGMPSSVKTFIEKEIWSRDWLSQVAIATLAVRGALLDASYRKHAVGMFRKLEDAASEQERARYWRQLRELVELGPTPDEAAQGMGL